jgi:hypothetical protein
MSVTKPNLFQACRKMLESLDMENVDDDGIF